MKITAQLIDEVFESEEWRIHVQDWIDLRIDGGREELRRLEEVISTAAPFCSKLGLSMTAFQYGVEVGKKLGEMEYLERSVNE